MQIRFSTETTQTVYPCRQTIVSSPDASQRHFLWLLLQCSLLVQFIAQDPQACLFPSRAFLSTNSTTLRLMRKTDLIRRPAYTGSTCEVPVMTWSLIRTTSPKTKLVDWHQVIRWDESQTLIASLNSATALVLHSVCTLFVNKSQHVSKYYYHLVSPLSIGR